MQNITSEQFQNPITISLKDVKPIPLAYIYAAAHSLGFDTESS